MNLFSRISWNSYNGPNSHYLRRPCTHAQRWEPQTRRVQTVAEDTPVRRPRHFVTFLLRIPLRNHLTYLLIYPLPLPHEIQKNLKTGCRHTHTLMEHITPGWFAVAVKNDVSQTWVDMACGNFSHSCVLGDRDGHITGRMCSTGQHTVCNIGMEEKAVSVEISVTTTWWRCPLKGLHLQCRQSMFKISNTITAVKVNKT